MSDYVDLHCHYVPGVDDGVDTCEEGVALCQGLSELGYARVVATPHMRPALFDNEAPALRAAFDAFARTAQEQPGMPELGLGCEHFFEDVVLQRLLTDQGLPLPGGHAALIELPERQFPLGLQQRFFELQVRGIRPVLAHPERYREVFRSSEPLDRLADMGVPLQLDLMSLTGKYGRAPRKAAERLLDEGRYYLACSDCHRPKDVPRVAEGIERLHERVGAADAHRLLALHPAALLDGTAEP